MTASNKNTYSQKATLFPQKALRRRWRYSFYLLLLCLSFSNRAYSANGEEYRVKAIWLINLAKFVDLPKNDRETLTIGVVGKNRFGDILTSLEGKTILGKELNFRHFPSDADDIHDYLECSILFISSSEQDNYYRILPKLSGSGILTVGESNNFLNEGGMINFLIIKNRIRYEVNRKAVTDENLRISSKFLGRAYRVLSKSEEVDQP